MDIIASFFISFILLVFSSIKNIFVGYTLTLCLLIFIGISLRRGFGFKDIMCMAYSGGKKSLIVVQVFVLIGAIISTWMAAGTVSSIVYYGIKFLNPRVFILSAFIISSLVSLLIGTSLGTVGTVGVALIVMARGGGAPVSMTAGAIVAGAYFGDRCSPMSSSANLIASLTDTDLYANIKNMIRTSIVPLIFSILLYIVISIKYPLSVESNIIGNEIVKYFRIGFIMFIPAILIIIMALLKINVKLSMVISIICASFIAVLIQGHSIFDVLRYIINGYTIEQESYLRNIIKGGGIISMLKVGFVVFISSAFTGIFEGTSILKGVENLIAKSRNRVEQFIITIVVSIGTSAFGCTQALAVILSHALVKKSYDNMSIAREELAVDLENTAIVIAPLIPWNIAVLVPLTTLSAGFDSIFYCFYLYLLPLINIIDIIIRGKRV